ncbi:acetylcholinesterase-1-like [Haemaphysalis longicornis]
MPQNARSNKTPTCRLLPTAASLFGRLLVTAILLTAGLFHCDSEPAPSPSPIVRIEEGLIAGTRLASGKSSVDAFLGIPYAEAPVDDLRFTKPKAVAPWNGTYNATTKPRACWQTPLRLLKGAPLDYYSSASEDCLYLNVWRRSTTCSGSASCKEERPVVVFIHGGGFQWGDSALFLYDPANFVALSDVVFVTFNYRVSIFGFLSLDRPELPGNFGLWDQHLVLKWVQRNIGRFGGDPKSVTVMGQSAGGTSVGLQAASPQSHDLFQRAVMMSATPLSLILGFSHRGTGKFIHVAGVLGCYDHKKNLDEQLDGIMSCLRKLQPSFVIQTLETLDPTQQLFSPVFGDDFFPDHPLAKNTWKKLALKQVILGTTLDEGTVIFENIQYTAPGLKNVLTTDYRLAITIAMQPLFGISVRPARRIVEAYFGGPDIHHTNDEVTKIFSQLLGDAVFYCPVKLTADITAEQGIEAYRFMFAHRASHSFWPKWMGVVHGDDIMYALGSLPFMKDKSRYVQAMCSACDENLQKANYTSGEETLMEQMVAAISSFAKSGKPVWPVSGVEWPRYTPDRPDVLYLRPGNFTTLREAKARDCELWRPHLLMK